MLNKLLDDKEKAIKAVIKMAENCGTKIILKGRHNCGGIKMIINGKWYCDKCGKINNVSET